ncbi:sulfite exporter TauE/SafE family protein [Actinobacillus equuli subsp. equuli]|uniref:Probable membrane transporter protein n=1 Tax=Actinobacillus equuli subsp. equuli TaxID=202947 RepID=A0A9X4G4Z8_ACTEU|nr:sulfite exporter TauE/SafE family protein [Actinobacillus equuli]MDE8034534.1 sulfite exporter TauE/SafE family protein [Actinobacillus equuli subsp. equuli]MDG4947582.1 sulfite exporter TauE/SafE family protein [Actinobacillus equuli subsp. haemolyticus]MDG4953031.1 sulfite exporter TauE/SafE family protein [Actinobacillus equuli subsp. equuli]WGE48162.1 sulfite exporter TauE/SafE family protein [Actinobacillus equuli subsp. equuli]WGE54538.1 sulfite exporter TauE/SafE family protein [Acti
MIEVFFSCLALGTIVGFLAGLFGIGGGLIIVPSLVYLLPMAGVTPENLMSVALGTSFSTIVITAFSSAQRHHKLGNVDIQVSKYFIPALMTSVFLAGLVISNLDAKLMSKIFAIMVLYLAARMLFSLKKTPQIKPLTTQSTIIAGGVIGMLSSMAGIAGGAFIVPFLNSRGFEMKRAIGTSSFCGAFLGLSGTISFIVSGWNVEMPDYSLGYVYLPALFGITLTSYFTSKLGANAANVLPVAILKKAFAVMLVAIAVNMFLK